MVYLVLIYIVALGDPHGGSFALRPIVSINLQSGGYSLVSKTETENGIEYELIKEN